MRKGHYKTIVIGLLLAPVLCCLVGVGAFLHVAVSHVTTQEQKRIDLQQQMEELAKAAADLARRLAETEKRIAELRRKLSEDRDHAEAAQRLEEELRRLLARKAAIDQAIEATQDISAPGDDNQPSPTSDGLQTELTQKQSALTAAKAEHDRLLATLSGLGPPVEDGDDECDVTQIQGTGERDAPTPVYVECLAEGATIQPENTLFSASPNEQERQAFLKAAKRTGYVLFLIRPSGFASFGQYRDLVLSDRGDSGKSIDFGYEPVNQDWKLIYPQAGE
ncbi:MAG: hypothetical protein ISR77_15535 [Pirellulaceae bacterium]|nr:hypothetical protein [Pirellulaceae bacterium]